MERNYMHDGKKTMKRPFFSIIIATYNSGETLEYTLKSIDNQDFDCEEFEILVIDGGSTDDTLEIAKKYNARIIDNPYRLPEYAKLIGEENALGVYAIRIDSDEEFVNNSQLKRKRDFFVNHTEIKLLIENMKEKGRKELCGVSAAYLNILGDPFSYFIYRTNNDKCTTYKNNIVWGENNENIMRFTKEDLFPLADSGGCAYSLDYIREEFPMEYNTIGFVCGVYDRIIERTGVCGCIKGDNVKHNCRSDLKTYFRKLRFRVINNIFHKEESGFSSRNNSAAKRRVLLFGLYCLVIPLPILDSIRLSIKYKDMTFMLHFIYLYYVCLEIVFSCIIKICGGNRTNRQYG